MAEDFSIESKVENVAYFFDGHEYCSIALKDGNSKHEIQPNSYFVCAGTKMCEFAEKSMASDVTVRLYGKKYAAGKYTTFGIEYGGKTAKYRD